LSKRVRLIPEVWPWLESHRDIATPEARRFTITIQRKVGSSRKKVMIRVEEDDLEFVVLLVHAEDW
jgi:hypothetical protein